MKNVMVRMKTSRQQWITYAFVIAAYIVLQILSGQKVLSSTARGMLVPICAYVVMAVSLNLTVGVMGELSLGHAGFMSVGAFMGTTAAVSLQGVIASAPLRLAIAMAVGAVFAAVIGFLIGIPVLRLRGDYLAIVTLAFGEIIKSIFTNFTSVSTVAATTFASCRLRRIWRRAESSSSAGRWASAAYRRSLRSPAALSL